MSTNYYIKEGDDTKLSPKKGTWYIIRQTWDGDTKISETCVAWRGSEAEAEARREELLRRVW